MKIYFDENMLFAREFFSEFGQLTGFNGRSLNADQLTDADVLLVRSITHVNEALLAANKNIQFVGTATIGTDHIDKTYLNEQKINFSSAPGCNAVSVAEYVISALVVLSERYVIDLLSLTVGIVGAGNTGTRLSEKLSALGIKHVLCDPLLAKKQTDSRNFVSLEQALACDVVSLHVPKTMQGAHATYHLLNDARLSSMSDNQILINACRGEVVDNQALLLMKQKGHKLKLVLDVWENEPNILQQLIPYCDIATAHIAGYSLEGKARGTEMLYQALCHHLGIVPSKKLSSMLPVPAINKLRINQVFDQLVLNQLVKMVYDVRRDDGIFRQQIDQQNKTNSGFDQIRKTYPARREFSAIAVKNADQVKCDVLHQLGFSD
jgi:erythronate-4-phosphate dehydrogenase